MSTLDVPQCPHVGGGLSFRSPLPGARPHQPRSRGVTVLQAHHLGRQATTVGRGFLFGQTGDGQEGRKVLARGIARGKEYVRRNTTCGIEFASADARARSLPPPCHCFRAARHGGSQEPSDVFLPSGLLIGVTVSPWSLAQAVSNPMGSFDQAGQRRAQRVSRPGWVGSGPRICAVQSTRRPPRSDSTHSRWRLCVGGLLDERAVL